MIPQKVHSEGVDTGSILWDNENMNNEVTPNAFATAADAAGLTEVFRLCSRNARVRWLVSGTSLIGEGTVRSVGDERGYFLRQDANAFDAHVRITTSAGLEWFPHIRQVIQMLADGEMGEV